MVEPVILGWDIGGAHLKVAAVRGARVVGVLCLPCPLWQGVGELDRALAKAIAKMPRAGFHAVTMTGELADCFRDREQGVKAILARFARIAPVERTRIFAGRMGFLAQRKATSCTREVASANWLASAQFVAGASRDALWIDVGSTTTDLVPIRSGEVKADGFTDADRLARGELVYTGVARTSIMALARHMRLRSRVIPVMAEHFATTADVYRLIGELPRGADLLAAADNGAKTAEASARRLARMIGCDLDSAPMREWKRSAAHLAALQLELIEDSCRRVLSRQAISPRAPVVGAGVGRFLARRVARRLRRPYCDFDSLVQAAQRWSSRISDCAPAVATALLASECL